MPVRPPDAKRILVELPADFMSATNADAQSADALIYLLIEARKQLADPKARDEARASIRRLTAALYEINVGSVEVRRRAMQRVLDQVNTEPWPDGSASAFARASLADRVDAAAWRLAIEIPGASVPRDVLRDAVELWPTKRRSAKTNALHALAKALDCDAPTLMQLMSNDRTERNALRAKRRKERKT